MRKRFKNYVKQLKVLNIMIILPFLIASFDTIDPCLTEVRSVFDKMNESAISGKVFHLNYDIKAFLNEKDNTGNNIISTSSIEMMTTNKYSWLLSNQMKVYKDNINTVTVIPDRKLIYLSDAVNGKKDENLYDKLKQLQDTIFKYSEKIECVKVNDQSYNKIVTLFLKEKFSKFMEMKKVSYYINTKENTLHRVYVEYLPDRQYKSLDYIFSEEDFDYKKTNIALPVEQLLYSENRILKQEYKGYKVIDNRKKSYKK